MTDVVDRLDANVEPGGEAGGNRPDVLSRVFEAVGDPLPCRTGLVGAPVERNRSWGEVKIAGSPGDRHLAGVRPGTDLWRIEMNRGWSAVHFHPGLRRIARRRGLIAQA